MSNCQGRFERAAERLFGLFRWRKKSFLSVLSVPSIQSGKKVYLVYLVCFVCFVGGGKSLFRLFGLFRHKMGKWATEIYPVIDNIIIAVAIVVNGIVMLIDL